MKNNIVIIQNSIKTVWLFRAEYIKQLLSQKKNVYVLAPLDCVESYNNLKSLGVKVFSTTINSTSTLQKLKLALWLNFTLLKIKFFVGNDSVLVVHFISTFLLILPTYVFVNSPIIIYVEGLGSLLLRSQWLKSIVKFMLRKKNTTRVFCNTDEKKHLGKPNDIVSNGIGVDLATFSLPVLRNGLRKSKTLKLLFVGRLIKDKGIMDAIECFKRLELNLNLNVQLDVVGDVFLSNPSSLSNGDIQNIKLNSPNIVFHGYTDKVQHFYEAADILLLPSRREGFPVCVMEATISGIPSVCYDVPGCSEAITQINGRLVEYGSLSGLAKAVKELSERLESQSLLRTDISNFGQLNFNRKIKSKEFVNIINGL